MLLEIQKKWRLAVLCFVFFIFTIVWFGVIYMTSYAPYIQMYPALEYILFTIMAGFCMICILTCIFRLIDKMSRWQLWIFEFVVAGCMVWLSTKMISTFHIVPLNDSHTILDLAYSMAFGQETVISPDNIYANYFTKYQNNNTLFLFLYEFYTYNFGKAIIDPYIPAFQLNALALFASLFLTCVIAKKKRGPKAAAKILFVTAISPIFYFSIFWVYSNTLSLPLFVFLILLGIYLYESRYYFSKLVICVAIGVFSAIAYGLRPTSVFPVLALAVCGVGFFIKKLLQEDGFAKKRLFSLKWLLCVFVLIASLLLETDYLTQMSDSYFASLTGKSFPVTHWLMMGSYNHGIYHLEDDEFTFALPDYQKTQVTLERTIDNYEYNGVIGTIGLFVDKMEILWSKGDFDLGKRLYISADYNPHESWIFRQNDMPFKMYCGGLWLAVISLVNYSFIKRIRAKKADNFHFCLSVILLGAIVFYLLWEVKAGYAITFLPAIGILMTMGYDDLEADGKLDFVFSKKWRVLLSCILSVAVIVYFTYQTYIRTDQYHYNTCFMAPYWSDPVPLHNGESLTQTFYPSHRFNRMDLLVDGHRLKENDCAYLVELYDGEGNLLEENILTTAIEKKYVLTLVLQDTYEANTETGYLVKFTKQRNENGNYLLKQRKTILIDTYKGELIMNDEPQPGDLHMDVYEYIESELPTIEEEVMAAVYGEDFDSTDVQDATTEDEKRSMD